AYRPKRMLSHHPECTVYDHRSTLVLFDRQGLEQRVWGCASGPYQSLRTNLLRGTQDHCPGAGVNQAGIEVENHATVSHLRQCIAGQRLTQLGQDAVARMDKDDG